MAKTQTPEAPPPAPAKVRRAPRRPSAELQAMAQIDNILCDLTDVEARRVLGWLQSKELDKLPVHGGPPEPSPVMADGYSQTEPA